MPRRRRKRRQRLERQEQRQEAMAAGVPVSEEVAPSSEGTTGGGISFSGAAGGLLGAGMLFTLATAVLIDPLEGSRLWAIAFAFIGLFFLPAVAVSIVRDHPRRRSVLRITTIGVMLLAMLGLATPGLGIVFAAIMAPPTALLAIGAGFIFQRSGSSA
ncbi:MAG: hypothetical protein IIA90_04090 [Chloroflexi bacterium]|nr:hypothetical protein [Chloroflexota bacterium]